MFKKGLIKVIPILLVLDVLIRKDKKKAVHVRMKNMTGRQDKSIMLNEQRMVFGLISLWTEQQRTHCWPSVDISLWLTDC